MPGFTIGARRLCAAYLISFASLQTHSALAQADQRSFKNLVIFGDSLSDNGNLFSRSFKSVPAVPYWQGRFSNGPVWSEIAFAQRGIPVKNYAVAGMMTSIPYQYSLGEMQWHAFYLGFRDVLTRNLGRVIGSYLDGQARENEALADNLHVFFVGNVNYLSAGDMAYFKNAYQNHYLEPLQNYAAATVADLGHALERLYGAGARQFVIYNLPDFSKAPNDDPTVTYLPGILSTFGQMHNHELTGLLERLRATYGDATFSIFDSFATLNKTYEQAVPYGFSVTQSSCYLGGWINKWGREKFTACQDPNSYVFYDPYHPSSRAHCYISWNFFNHLVREDFVSGEEMSEEDMMAACRS